MKNQLLASVSQLQKKLLDKIWKSLERGGLRQMNFYVITLQTDRWLLN
jgi:hypothetical protein